MILTQPTKPLTGDAGHWHERGGIYHICGSLLQDYEDVGVLSARMYGKGSYHTWDEGTFHVYIFPLKGHVAAGGERDDALI